MIRSSAEEPSSAIVLQSPCHQLHQYGLDDLQTLPGIFQSTEKRDAYVFQVGLERLHEELVFARERPVKRKPVDRHSVNELLHGRCLIAFIPKGDHRPVQNFFTVEFFWPWHRFVLWSEL
jgi:hypothetical protein